jgi:thioredoxin reductase (NADPH)
MVARTNVCATGVEWRRLNLPNEDKLLGRGLYYGAGASEAPLCGGEDVYVVGGGNSAGQAVMHLASAIAKRGYEGVRRDGVTSRDGVM